MSKIDDTVRRETVYIAAWVIILSVIMQAVFLIAGQWNIKALAGNILSSAAAVLNFLLMGITIQKAVDKDQKDAASMMKFSQSGRLFMQFAAAAVGVLFLNPVSSILPLFFPRIAVAFRPFVGKKFGNLLPETEASNDETVE
ncbi:MAG: hypothetical protein II685_07400 [Clostridia bacterium]|nr:hypothetical protein [Clostridia bacterium]